MNMNQTQMIINNFFFQPSPKDPPGASGAGAGYVYDGNQIVGNRNIKTAIVQQRR